MEQVNILTPDNIQANTIMAISHALKRNKHVLKVDFWLFNIMDDLINAISITHQMPSLTTIMIDPDPSWTQLPSDTLFQALENALQRNDKHCLS